jgi:2-C-methyl-D-erythritol 4-phosphate cytidylyltransferase
MLGCVLVPGGSSARWESVRSGLSEVPDDATHIAVHDGARPCVGGGLLDRVFAAAARFDAVVPGVAVRDTLKLVEEMGDGVEADPLDAVLGDAGKVEAGGMRVTGGVERDGVVLVQTPQVFEAGLLRRAYGQADLDSTDDAGLVERLGEEVRVVEGDVMNVKITTPGDLELARLVLGSSGVDDRPAHKRF